MTEPEQTTISVEDISSVSDKLKALMQDLPEDERNVLGAILTRAAASQASDEDLSGLNLGDDPFDVQLERAVGIAEPGVERRAARGTSTISWSYKF